MEICVSNFSAHRIDWMRTRKRKIIFICFEYIRNDGVENVLYAFYVSTNIIIALHADIWRTYGRQMVQCMLRQTALVSKIPNSNTIFRSMLKRWKILQFTFSHMKWIHRKQKKKLKKNADTWKEWSSHRDSTYTHTEPSNRQQQKKRNRIEIIFSHREECVTFFGDSEPIHSTLTHSLTVENRRKLYL